MDKWQIISWLIDEASGFDDNYRSAKTDEELEELLSELNNRKEISLPEFDTEKPEEMVQILMDHFNNNVTLISLVLSHYFPEDFFFYRVSKLEDEIFEGFNFFSEIIPEFGFYFNKIGRTGFDKYLTLNEALFEFGVTFWPDKEGEELQSILSYFVYQGLGSLFLDKGTDRRYWIMATREEYFEELDNENEITWSGRKEMQPGDLVFMYRTSPRKAVTGLYRVKEAPLFEPWGAWNGFWVKLEKVTGLPDIAFSTLRKDPVIGRWGTVVKQFQGTVTDPVPYPIYNRLLELIPDKIKKEHALEPEVVAPLDKVDLFTSEADFEEKVIVPLLKGWSFKYKAQYPCSFRFGSQYHQGYLDFQVEDDKGPLTLIEAKLRVRNDKDLELAVDQAKSYALMLGIPSFLVASPEAFWLYNLQQHNANLVTKIPTQNLQANLDELKRSLLKASGRV